MSVFGDDVVERKRKARGLVSGGKQQPLIPLPEEDEAPEPEPVQDEAPRSEKQAPVVPLPPGQDEKNREALLKSAEAGVTPMAAMGAAIGAGPLARLGVRAAAAFPRAAQAAPAIGAGVEGLVLGEAAPPTGGAAQAAADAVEGVARKVGERGAALNPIPAALEAADNVAGKAVNAVIDRLRPVRRVAEKVADKAGVRYADALSDFRLPASNLTVDQRLALVRSAQNAASHDALELTRSMTNKFADRTEMEAFGKYLFAKDELARLKSGNRVQMREVTQPDGTVLRYQPTEADLQDEIRNATQGFLYDPDSPMKLRAPDQMGRLATLEEDYRREAEKVRQTLIRAGFIKPETKREDWVHHIVTKWYDDDTPGGGSFMGGVGTSRPNAAKRAVGSSDEILRDPYKTLAVAKYQADRGNLAREFEKEITSSFGVDISDPLNFHPDQHALYSFTGEGGKPVMIGGEQAQRLVMEGKVPPGFHALPKQLAEGMEAFNTDTGKKVPAMVGAVLDLPARYARNTQLLLSPSFQLAQWPADFMTHLFNVPVSKWGTFTKEAVKNVGVLWKEYRKVLSEEGTSDILTAMRKRGIVTDVLENLWDKENVGNLVTNKALADTMRPQPATTRQALGDAWEKIIDPIKALGQIRESSLKAATAKVWEEMGATPHSAAHWANRISGNYFKTTADGRVYSKIALYAKWYAEQATRLTVDIAHNPVTGRSDWEGLKSGPAPKIVALGLLTYALNNRNPEIAKAAENLGAQDRASIVLDVDENGNPLVMSADTLLRVGAAWGGGAAELATSPRAGFKNIMDAITTRSMANPVVGAAGLALGARNVPREEEGLTDAEKRDLNQRRGGFDVTPDTQSYVDLLTGGPGRTYKAFRESRSDTPTLERFNAVTGGAGFRVAKKNATDRVAQERAQDGDAYESRFINAMRGGDAKELARLDETKAWLIQHGYTEAQLKALLTRGARNAAEIQNLERRDAVARQRRYMTPYGGDTEPAGGAGSTRRLSRYRGGMLGSD